MRFKIRKGVLLRFQDADAESIMIPSRVRKIGECAFEKCECLRHVTLPSQLEEISEYAFSECTNLKDVIFSGSKKPKTPLVIRDRAFSGCYHLEQVTLPETITAIGSFAFSDCTDLRRLAPASYTEEGGAYIPEGFSSLGSNVFEDCFSLPSLYLPSTIQSCGKHVLRGCRALRDVVIRIPDGSEYHFPTVEPDDILDVLLLQKYDSVAGSPGLTCALGAMLQNGYRGLTAASYLAENKKLLLWDERVLLAVIRTDLLPAFLQCDELMKLWEQEDTLRLYNLLLSGNDCARTLGNARSLGDVMRCKCFEQHCTAKQLEKLLIHMIGADDDPDVNPEKGLYRLLFTGRIKKRTEPKRRDAAKLITFLEEAHIAEQLPDAILEKLAVLANDNGEYDLQLFWLRHRKNSSSEDRFGIIERFDL